MATHPAVHPSADALGALVQGTLNDSTATTLISHLENCPDCCQQVAALPGGNDYLDRLRQTGSFSSTSTAARTITQFPGGTKPSPSNPAIANLPPELVANPQYEILRELGRGGMGVVYLAKNKLMDRLEVLKVVNKALLDHPGAVERFLREIRSAAKLSHANVVGAYSAVQQGELLAFAMEYVEGQDLASLVKSQGQLPILNACYYVQQAALGLQHAYEKGMVHRDIKPQNLILAREGKKHIVKVLDFGLAKATREKTDDTGLTGEGAMLGTPDYIAPEQTLDAAKADIRADIYSLGCTLYYLLSGHPPFSASSLGAILLAHQMQEPKPLNLERPEVPEELALVVRKMMSKSPDKRFQTPKEVVQALNPFVKQTATAKTSPEPSTGTAETKHLAKKETKTDQAPATKVDTPKKQSKPAVVQSQKKEAVPEDEPVAAAPIRRRNWVLDGVIGVGLLVVAGVGLWAGGVFKVKTADGTLVLENLPAEAVVMVDGEHVTVDVGDGKPVEIHVAAGKKHQLEVVKSGVKVFGQEVELGEGERQPIRVSLEPEGVAAKSSVQKGAASKNVPPKGTTAKQPPETKVAVKQPPPDTSKGPAPKGPPVVVGSKKGGKQPSPGVHLVEAPGYVPLFNGKDLTGWKTLPTKQQGNWKVVNGILVSGGSFSHLFSERSDYDNFHIRIEAMINDGGNSGLFFRAQPTGQFPRGYEAQINSTGRDPVKTGSLYGIVDVRDHLTKPGEWFTQEILTEGDHIVIKINGKTVVDAHDPRFKKGAFALQQHDAGTVVKFRKIEIKERK